MLEVGRLHREMEIHDCPVLLFDMNQVRAKVRSVKRLGVKYNCQFLFAAKASLDPRIIRFLAEEGIGFDISNDGELSVLKEVLNGKLADLFISATGPGVTGITNFADVNVVNAGSPEQVRWLKHYLKGPCLSGVRIKCDPIRAYNSLGKTSHFGIQPDALSNWPASALHFHQSGGKSENIYDKLIEYVRQCLDLMPQNPKHINFGGGAYFLDFAALERVLVNIRKSIPSEIDIFFEFGSYWFTGNGYGIGKVIDHNIHDDAHRSVILDLSQTCHLTWSTILPLNADPVFNQEHQKISIFGGTCYEGDYLGTFSYPNDVKLEKIFSRNKPFIVKHVDIYSASWNKGFNGLPPAKVVYHNLETAQTGEAEFAASIMT